MSADRYSYPRRERKNPLNEILDFGPDTEAQPDGFSDRVQQIVRKLKDISQRIDRLGGEKLTDEE